MMKTLLILMSAMLLMGCPKKDEAAIDPPDREVPIETGEVKAEAEIPALVPPVAVPQEYRDIAEREITEENAEAMANELQREIEEDDE